MHHGDCCTNAQKYSTHRGGDGTFRWRASGAIWGINNNSGMRWKLMALDAMSSVTSGNASAGRSGDVSDGAGAGELQQNRQRHGGAATLRQPHPRHTLLVAMFL